MIFFGWFFVVKLWWFSGADVVFGWWVFGFEKMPLFENISVEKAAAEWWRRGRLKDKCGDPSLRSG